MKVNAAVRKETGHIALGVLVGDILMLVVFAVLKRLDYTVFLGAALGSIGAVLNFFAMGMAVQRAMNDPDRAKAIVQRSYTKRMLGMVAVMVVGFVVPWFHNVAVVVPLLFPSITIHVMRLLGVYKPQEKGGEEE